MYHRIADADLDPWKLAVSPDQFENQLVALGRRRQVLPLRLFAQLHRENRLPPDAVAITFDDGYACNAVVAAPLLAKYGFAATFFLTGGAIESGREFWWDELARLVFETGIDTLSGSFGGAEFKFDLRPEAKSNRDFDATAEPQTEGEKAYLRLWGALRNRSAVEQTAALDRLWRSYRDEIPPARPSHRPMTPDEARNLGSGELAEIGAHTITHPPLSNLDFEGQWHEITTSRVACEKLAQSPVTSFAYPFGDFDETTHEVVRVAGFQLACTTVQGPVAPRTDQLRLPRVQVRNWNAETFISALEAF